MPALESTRRKKTARKNVLKGLLANPAVECPKCSHLTAKLMECEHCHARWTDKELNVRREAKRLKIVQRARNAEDEDTREYLLDAASRLVIE
jgi:hypothetical protein